LTVQAIKKRIAAVLIAFYWIAVAYVALAVLRHYGRLAISLATGFLNAIHS
jgi:hypothetical protein